MNRQDLRQRPPDYSYASGNFRKSYGNLMMNYKQNKSNKRSAHGYLKK